MLQSFWDKSTLLTLYTDLVLCQVNESQVTYAFVLLEQGFAKQEVIGISMRQECCCNKLAHR